MKGLLSTGPTPSSFIDNRALKGRRKSLVENSTDLTDKMKSKLGSEKPMELAFSILD